jgi:hypothetical protein
VIVRIDVRIEAEQSDGPNSYGSGLNFSESAQLTTAGFETASRVFTRCHELLATLKHEHSISTEGTKRR